MPKIIVASRYLKPTSKGTRSNLVKYIATRETVQKYSPKRKDTSVTENQKQLIMELIQINPDGKKTAGIFGLSEKSIKGKRFGTALRTARAECGYDRRQRNSGEICCGTPGR